MIAHYRSLIFRTISDQQCSALSSQALARLAEHRLAERPGWHPPSESSGMSSPITFFVVFLGSRTTESLRCTHCLLWCQKGCSWCVCGVWNFPCLSHIFWRLVRLVLMTYHGGVLLLSGYQADKARIQKQYKAIIDESVFSLYGSNLIMILNGVESRYPNGALWILNCVCCLTHRYK